MNIEYKKFEELNSEILADLYELEGYIFPKPLAKDKITRELSCKHNVFICMAYEGKKPLGYKVGFERSKRIYYSWIGGVIPDYRGKGIAKELMQMQHDFAGKNGYRVVCTQTDNSFKPMIILNLNSGFEIKGTLQSTGDEYITIIMEKSLD